MSRDLPSPEMLRKLLRYDPDTGKLFWQHRKIEMFAHERSWKMWNTKYFGKEAFTCLANGYRQGTIFYRGYQAHRVIWAIRHGKWVKYIDHINGVRDDNRIENLRSVTHKENMQNSARPKNNTSGVTGVCRAKALSKWMAYIRVDYKQIHLGFFTDKADAIAARKAAEEKYGFHKNHGR